MGGKPNPGTKADKRLTENAATTPSARASTPTKQGGKKQPMTPAQHVAKIKQMADPASPVGMKQPMTAQEQAGMQCK